MLDQPVINPRDHYHRQWKEARRRIGMEAKPKPVVLPPVVVEPTIEEIVSEPLSSDDPEAIVVMLDNPPPRRVPMQANAHVCAYLRHKLSIADRGPARPTTRMILESASRITGFSLLDIESQRRSLDLVLVRHAVMYLARKLTVSGLPEIGRRIGNRDHSTVMHAIARIEKIKDRRDIDALLCRIESDVEEALR